MLTLDRTKARMRPGSNFVLAVALLCGTALTAGVLEAPAHAQKRGKKDKAPKTDYSKKFLASYQAADALLKATPADVAGAQAAIPGVLADIKTGDDRMAAGGLLFNTGLATEDLKLQRQGYDLMIESGKVPADKAGTYFYNAGQLAFQDGDGDTARSRFKEALAAGYEADLENVIASTYFNEDRYSEGLAYYQSIIDADLAAGRVPQEDWIFNAFSAAYNNDMIREAIDLASLNTRYHPSPKNWRNAISVQRNFVEMEREVLLDLMRLAYRTETVDSDRDYADYIEAAGASRNPGEVKRLVDEALANGTFNTSDPFVQDARTTANERIAADRAGLQALERDARAPSATAVTASAAGDVFLNYGQSAKAEEIYRIALIKAGVNEGRVMTRLGITQADQGKFAEAAATFAKVGGARKAVAGLWESYARGKMTAVTPSAAEPMMADDAAM